MFLVGLRGFVISIGLLGLFFGLLLLRSCILSIPVAASYCHQSYLSEAAALFLVYLPLVPPIPDFKQKPPKYATTYPQPPHSPPPYLSSSTHQLATQQPSKPNPQAQHNHEQKVAH